MKRLRTMSTRLDSWGHVERDDDPSGSLEHFSREAIEARVQDFLKTKIPGASDQPATGKNNDTNGPTITTEPTASQV